MTDDDWFGREQLRELISMTHDFGEREQWRFAARCLARALDWVAHPLLPDIVEVCGRLAARPGDRRLLGALERLAFDFLPEGLLDEELEDFAGLDDALSELLRIAPDLEAVARGCRDSLGFGWGGSGDELFQIDILRDLVPPPSARPWDSAWETETAILLAGVIESRAEFSLSPVFADALEDAGCGCAARLGHLRERGDSHGPGCWALAPARVARRAATPRFSQENA